MKNRISVIVDPMEQLNLLYTKSGEETIQKN